MEFTKPYLLQNQNLILTFPLSPPPTPFFSKVVKNLLFVAKVLYLLEPDSGDKQGNIKEDMEEQEVFGDGTAREGVEEHRACADEKEEQGKPATLLWLIQKLSRIATVEAAYSPRNPLKVWCICKMPESSLFFFFLILMILAILPRFLLEPLNPEL